jgi:hypothetical protein
MNAPLLRVFLVRAEHVQAFHIGSGPQGGWEVSQWQDAQLLQQRGYRDWHRVERVLSSFRRQITQLHQQGWRNAVTAV